MNSNQNWRKKLRVVIFESDTRAGKTFDQVLIVAILLSVVVVTLESVASIRAEHQAALVAAEWFFTVLFTIEYVARVVAAKPALQYPKSFFGAIDLLAILPTYLSLFFAGAQSLQVIRIFRLLRIFRIYKLAHYLQEAQVLGVALAASRAKIIVFLMVIVSTVITMGAMMYLIEGPEHGFTSIPVGVYWAVVTMTTVGYGDISPQTPIGQTFASLLMIVGYGIIAVPTGIVSSEIANASRQARDRKEPNAFCRHCGAKHDARETSG